MPALAAFAGVLWLLYRRFSKRKSWGRGRPQARVGGGALPASGQAAAVSLKPPPENPNVEALVQAAASLHRSGFRGEAMLGDASGIAVYSAPLNLWLAWANTLLAPLGRSGEAVVAGACAFFLVVMIATGSFGRSWPLVGMVATLLTALALAWIAASLEGQGKGKGMLANALEAGLSSISSLGGTAVVIHAKLDIQQGPQAALVWQAIFARAAAPRAVAGGGRGDHGFARRNGLGFLVVGGEPTRPLVSVAPGAVGLLEVFVLQPMVPSAGDDFSRGLAVHHYAVARAPLCGPAAAAAAAAPLSELLSEAHSGSLATATGAGGGSAEQRDVARPEEVVPQVAEQALRRIQRLCDGRDGGVWVEAEPSGALKLSTQEAGTRFPIVRGIVEVAVSEVAELGYEGEGPAAKAAQLAAEILCFFCSALGQELTDPMRGGSKVLGDFGQDGTGMWLTHLTWKPNPMVAAADGAFVQAVERRVVEDDVVAETVAGERFTHVTVPAPAELAARYGNEMDTARAGQTYKPQKMLFSAMDVLARADGSVRVSYALHADPNVSRMTPTSMVRGFLLQAPKCCLQFLDMAKNLCVPISVALQQPGTGEKMEEVQIAGRATQVSACLASTLADRGAGARVADTS